MPEAPYSPNEVQRIAAVEKSRMLGTPAEERFDKITRLARRLFNVPMAAIDIVASKVAWIKSAQGFDEVIGIRKHSYCHYTVLKNEICLVTDAREDARFFDSAFSHTWVSYAGVPLCFEGERIGVLCIGDKVPRQFTEEDQEGLRDLAVLAEQELKVCSLSQTQLELAHENEELEMKNRIDGLTHGWNREAILNILSQECARKKDSVGVFMIDVDFFKKINDTYGHLAGDEVLRIFAERTRAVLRPMDASGRYGGDEFLAVLTNITKEDALKIASRLCQEMNQTPVPFEKHLIPVSCTVGCAIKKGNESPESLIKRADEALYKAKEAGRNCAKI